MRTRLLLGTVLLTAATIALFFIPAADAAAEAEREAQELELLQEASDAAALLGARQEAREQEGLYDDESDDESDEDESEEDEDEEDEDEGPTGAAEDHTFALYSPAGQLLLGTGPAEADVAVRSALAGRTATTRIGDLRVAAVPLASGGAVRAAEPAAEADDRSRDAVLRLAAVALVVVVAGSLAAWLLARRLTRPLQDLGRTAARIGGGDFTATSAPTGVTEIDEVGAALSSSAERIGDLVERERRFTSDASHQMRTPLAGLRLALEAELASPRDDPTAVLEESLGAVERLEATVAAFTDLARDAPTTFVALDEVADGARERWVAIVAAEGRRLEVDAGTGVTLPGRRAALDTIVDVLVDNAVHHGTGTVTIATDAQADHARLLVSDEGSCRLEDDALFARRRSGAGRTGIGLDLARTLAEAEGARLRLVARDPTTFQLLIPLRHTSPPTDTSPPR